jgi:hypothetical protein
MESQIAMQLSGLCNVLPDDLDVLAFLDDADRYERIDSFELSTEERDCACHYLGYLQACADFEECTIPQMLESYGIEIE